MKEKDALLWLGLCLTFLFILLITLPQGAKYYRLAAVAGLLVIPSGVIAFKLNRKDWSL